SVFTALYKAYRQGAFVPTPQSGEVHLLNAPCGQDHTATYVTSNSLPNLDAAGINVFASVIVRVGPGSAAVAYPGLNYTGTPQYITQAMGDFCLNNLPASLAIVPINRDFVPSSNMCKGCDLSGVDLSGLNLAGGDFTATVFHHANLTNTNFQSAILDQATFQSYGGDTILNGTDFLDAHLHCTDFQDSHLDNAFF